VLLTKNGIKMSHFAKVENGIVTQVLVIEQDQIDTGNWGNPSLWIQTSYNTHGNVHRDQNGKPDGGIAIRGNFAAVGMMYDEVNDVFLYEKPYPSWVLDTETWLWVAPIEKPEVVPCTVDGNKNIITGTNYDWDESMQTWVAYSTPRGYLD